MKTHFTIVSVFAASTLMLTGCSTISQTSTNASNANVSSIVNENANYIMNSTGGDVNTVSANIGNMNVANINSDRTRYENDLYDFSVEYPNSFSVNESSTALATSSNNYLLFEIGFKPTGVVGEPLRITVIDHSVDNWGDLDASVFGAVTTEEKSINGRTWNVFENNINSIIATEYQNYTYVLIISNDVLGERQWSEAYDIILNSLKFNS